MPEVEHTEPPAPDAGRERRRRRRRRHRSIPAWLVFYVTAGVAVVSTALVYVRGVQFLPFSVASCLLIVLVLVVNDRMGFTRSKRARRHSDSRVSFNKIEIAVLFGLLLLGVFVSLSAWVT